MSITIKDRDDRLGSNFIVKISTYIYGLINNVKIYHNSDIKYKNSIFIKPFIVNSTEKPKNYTEDTIKTLGGVRGTMSSPTIQLKQDLVSYFNEHLKKLFFDIVNNEAIQRNYKLPWSDNSKIICIHLRCDDRYNWNDYDGRGSAQYITNLIETNSFEKYNRDIMMSKGQDTQVCIDPNKLKNFITLFKKEHPEKEIHIIFYGRLPDQIQKLITEFKICVHTSKDPDYDLWLLLNSEILVLSKSSYSILAGFYHLGSKVYYPLWGTGVSCGLNSKYDKSGWIPYI